MNNSITSATEKLGGYAQVNGINMYYEIQGEGPALVLIHGGGSTIQTSFQTLLPLLTPHFETIAVELQAHGHTNDRDSASSFEQDADDVAELLKQLEVTRAHFLGFSNGGNTAMQIGIRHPHLVDKLVVISAFYKREGLMYGFFEGMEQASLENMPQLLQKAYLDITGDQKGLQAMHDRDKNRMLAFKDWSDDDLQAITAPMLLVVGDEDVVSVAHTLQMKQLIPHASLLVLPGNHGSFIGEVCTIIEGSKIPETTSMIITEFLNKSNF